MKTAISVPDPVFKEAEKLKKKLKMSRSQLYSQAVKSYVKAHRQSDVTRRLNEVLKDVDSQLDPAWARAQSRAIGRQDW
jgi:metal-responsive CopG/Arc/MetJ family transcriptional regulator